MWKLFDRKKIEEGLMVLAYHPDWICEDFCPDGIREGYYCAGAFISAKWNNDMDSWYEQEGFPTHWIEKPKFVPPVDPNQLNVFSESSKKYLYIDLETDSNGTGKDLSKLKLGDTIEVCIYEIPNKTFGLLRSIFKHSKRIGAKQILINLIDSHNYLETYQTFTFLTNESK